ncbi:hypothetical protein [Dyella sp. C9]|uniref:hypothetical protein n=1 Tax=Dyella sp. C9 TaxID=2202154 RepID=UPI000DF01ECC|nr:hypothetical protein [Dyella sp. C9]
MAVLVGIYLLDAEATEVPQDGCMAWIGRWVLYRSQGMDRCQWEPLTTGQTDGAFANRDEAVAGALEQGASFAREIQADPWLEPMPWPSVACGVMAAPSWSLRH